MNDKNTYVPLEILLLNDLLHSNAIDKDIYDKALQMIVSPEKEVKAA